MEPIKVIVKSNNNSVRIISKSAEDIFGVFCDLNSNVLDSGRTRDKGYFLSYDKSILDTKEFKDLSKSYKIELENI